MTFITSAIRIGAATAAAATLAVAAFTSPVLAAGDPHIRGEVVAIDGDVVTVATAASQPVEVTMAEGYTVLMYTPIALSDLTASDYIAIPSIRAPGGGQRALAVIRFPEAMRGFAEGEGEWDLMPGSRMTNATFAQFDGSDADGAITVVHGDETDTMTVPEGTPIVTFAPIEDRPLAVGDTAILFAKVDGDRLVAGLVGLSSDGSMPPL